MNNNFEHYCELPTPFGIFRMYDTGNELLRVITFGDINKLGANPLLRLHSSCISSEVFGALDCDCADQLRESMKVVAHEGAGIICHLHQEGRGQGLSNKIQAIYKMQTECLNTVESYNEMGLKQDIRDYTQAIDVLDTLKIKHVRLVSNNPRKRSALERAGIIVESVNTHPKVRVENADYLKIKNLKLGHDIPLDYESDSNAPIHFYHSDQSWGEFSNFSQHPIYLQDKIWITAEHFYQAQKFNNPDLQERVRTAVGPILAKQIATALEDEYLKPDWSEIKEKIMWQALVAKFTQNPELKSLLLSTKQRHIAEHTVHDKFWGDAGDGTGSNRLGELLLQLREVLREGKELQLCAG